VALVLPEQSIDTDNKIDAMRLVMSLLRSDDDGNHGGTSGNLWIVDGATAVPMARAFFRKHAGEVGFNVPRTGPFPSNPNTIDADDATVRQLAACMFRKFRKVIAEAYQEDQLRSVLATNQENVVNETAQSQTEIENAVGVDEDIA
jgi:hypothetical protein